jgi:energy-coupling factor transporter ATP-binding protein EcfA2
MQEEPKEPKEPNEPKETKESQEPENTNNVINATNVTNPTNPTNPTIHLDTPFKLPMEYLPEDQLCPIDKSVLSDLELIECTKQVNDTSSTNNESNDKSMYAHVFQPQSAFAKRYLGMWAKQFTTSVPHLQDTQRFIASVSKDKSRDDDSLIDYNKIEAIWTRIKTDTSFRDKFNYIDYTPLDMLNRSPTFLQCYSMYNLFSPLLSFLMPVIMLIVPFFLLKLQGVPITLPTYFGIIKLMLSQHAVGKLIFDMSSVGWDKRIYILVSVVFYIVQMYQNVVSCHRFYRNTFLVHDDLAAIRAYADATIKKMRQFAAHAITCGDTFAPFAADLQKNREQLERMVAALDRIDPPALTAKKCLQIGYVMQQYYAVFSDASIAACMQYSFGFNAFAEHVAHFGELLQNKRVAACEFVNTDQDKSKADQDSDKPKKKKKDKKKEEEDKKKEEDDTVGHSRIVNGYYVATVVTDGDEPVKNTVSLDKRLVITGPNASGKTTILKMTMLNILFSQQLGHGFYEAGTRIRPYHQLHSYLNIPDTSGRDSLFQAESRRCKEILDKLTGVPSGGQSPSVRHFCIFDELYSGTNPYEAIASAYGYIMHLTKHSNVDFMLTTHYIQLCKLFEQQNSNSDSDKGEKIANKSDLNECNESNKIRNLHMEVADRGNYDFKYLYALRPGISAIKGGIKVLYDLQYPASIVDTTRHILSTL